MNLTSLALQQFRNYSSHSFSFSPETTLIVGPNAIGKTAIIEAINALATGNSFRASSIEEMIRFDEELGRVKGIVARDDESIELELLLTRGLVQGKKTQKRLYSVNGNRRTKRVFTGNLLTVVFRPEDMRLVEGSPSRRREFMDTVLQLSSSEYEQALSTYTKALVRRNKLLLQIREGDAPRSTLTYWTLTILKHGEVIQRHRQALATYFHSVEFPLSFAVQYDSSVISEERLAQYAEREIAAGHTLVGPHKDDFQVLLNERNVALYGSRGQQRMAVLWLKTGELKYLTEQSHQQPVLLLDDILSELDDVHQHLVLDQVRKGQTIITSADAHLVPILEQVVPHLQVLPLS